MIDDLAVIMALFNEVLCWLHKDTMLRGEVSKVSSIGGPHVRIELMGPNIAYAQCEIIKGREPGVYGRIGQQFYDIGLLADPAISLRIQTFLLMASDQHAPPSSSIKVIA